VATPCFTNRPGVGIKRPNVRTVLTDKETIMDEKLIAALAFMFFAGFVIWVMAKYDKP